MADHKAVYETICKDKFEDILTEIKTIQRGLFIDNGEESVQSKLNRHERWIKIWGWLAVTIGGILSSVAAAIIIHRLLS